MAYPADARRWLDEDKAEFVSLTQIPIMRTKELVRKWVRIKDKQAAEMQRYLDDYTSADNLTAGTYYVDNPTAVGPKGPEVYPGRWRGVQVFREKDGSVVQVLRKGFLGHSGDSGAPLDEDEARLAQEFGLPITNDLQLREEWRYTDPSDHEEILIDLTAIKSILSPVIEGEAFTGILFACSDVQAVPNEDGSVRFSRLLTSMDTISALANLAALSPMITQEEELIKLFDFEPGDSETLLYTYDSIDPASQTYVMETLTPTNYETLAPVGQNWQFYDRKYVLKKDGTGTLAILFRKETWDATYTADKKKIQGNTMGGWMRSLALEVTGADRTQALADFATIVAETGGAFSTGTNYNIGDPVTYSGTNYIFIQPHLAGAWDINDVIEAEYLIGTRRITERGRGEFSVSGNMISVYNGTEASDAVVVMLRDPLTEYDRGVLRRVWFRRSLEAKETLITELTGAARTGYQFEGTDYVHHMFTVEDHGDGAYTVRQTLLQEFDENVDPFIVRIKPKITEYQQRIVVRMWRHLTQAGKEALVDPAGLARSSFVFETITYTHADCFIEDREDQGYTVRQIGIEVHDGVLDTDALVIHLRPQITAGPQNMLQRVWLHRSTTAKNTLIDAAGNARTDYSYEGVDYTHIDCRVEDHENGAYSVIQVLVELNTNTDNSDALVIRIKPAMTELDRSVIARTWRHLSLTGKDTLVAIGGNARSDYTFETKDYLHQDVFITDHDSGGYTVRQILTEDLGEGDFMIIRIKPNITEYQQKMIARVWRHISEATKDTITTPGTGAARTDFMFETLTYTHMDAHISEDGVDGYSVTQILIEVHDGVSDTDALVVRIKPGIGGSSTNILQRVWLHRSTDAKNTLTAAAGLARSNFVFETKTYTHADVIIEDHENGAYTVRQTLVDLTGTVTVYWNVDFTVTKTFTRSSNPDGLGFNATKTITYQMYISAHSSESAAWGEIDGTANLVAGASSVTGRSKYMWIAKYLTLTSIGDWV